MSFFLFVKIKSGWRKSASRIILLEYRVIVLLYFLTNDSVPLFIWVLQIVYTHQSCTLAYKSLLRRTPPTQIPGKLLNHPCSLSSSPFTFICQPSWARYNSSKPPLSLSPLSFFTYTQQTLYSVCGFRFPIHKIFFIDTTILWIFCPFDDNWDWIWTVDLMERIVGGKFKLGRKIGSGSFGEIFLGEHFFFSYIEASLCFSVFVWFPCAESS